MTTRGLAAGAVLAGLIVLACGEARADVKVRGTVVRLDDDEIYFDVGQASGLEPGRPARAWRRVSLKHPVTQRPVVDEIPLGDLEIKAVGVSLSIAVASGELEYPLEVGDIVEVLIEREEPKPPPPPPPPPRPVTPPGPEAPLPAPDPATRDVVEAWQGTIGRPLDARIASWEVFLAQHPDSPFVPAVRAELETLRTLREKFAVTSANAPGGEPHVDGVAHLPPTRALWHQALGLAFLARKAPLAGAWLHYRRLGTDTYRKLELARDGDGYLRGTIAAGEVQAPGVEYFVEVLTADRQVGSAIGSPLTPVRVDVAAPTETTLFVDKRNRSRVSVSTAYLDFGGFDERAGTTDRMTVFEADFLYRLRAGLYGIRVGLGVLSGEGGRKDPVADPMHPPKAAFNYGYTELEFRGRASTALIVRGITGQSQDGLGFGAEGKVRLGSEEGTNLTFGASTLAGVGFVSELKFQWMAFPRFPLGLGIAVGDQPTQGDLGVRFSADVGVRALSWLTPTLQVSYQGRSLDHSGMGAGLGLVFDW
jgi:hypothetical protein